MCVCSLARNCFASIHSKSSLNVDLRSLKVCWSDTSSTRDKCFFGLKEFAVELEVEGCGGTSGFVLFCPIFFRKEKEKCKVF